MERTWEKVSLFGWGENVPGSSRKALEEFLRALMSEALKAVVQTTVVELPEVSSSYFRASTGFCWSGWSSNLSCPFAALTGTRPPTSLAC